MVSDHFHHFTRLKILETRPAQVGIGATTLVFPFGEDAAFDGNAKCFGFAFFQGLQVVEALDE